MLPSHVTFWKHAITKAWCSPSHTIMITENGIFFLPIALFDIFFCMDLVANNFFKTVNTNMNTLYLKHIIWEKFEAIWESIG